LSLNDQKWLLEQLPESHKVQLSQSLKMANKFRCLTGESQFSQMLLNDTKRSTQLSFSDRNSLSSSMNQHVEKIISERGYISPFIYEFVAAFKNEVAV
jgi:hypothetical protein